MNKKTIFTIIGSVLLALVLFYLFGSHGSGPAVKPAMAPTEPLAPTETPIRGVMSPEVSADQALIDSYTAQLSDPVADKANVYFQRGLVYMRMQQYKAADHDFSDAIKLLPKSPIILFNRALAYREQQQYDLAVADLSEAITEKPDYVDALNARALIYVDQNSYFDALADYKSAIALNEDATNVYFNLGTLYTRMKKYDEAKQAFTDAIETNKPKDDATPEQTAKARKELMQAYLNRANVEVLMADNQAAFADADYVVSNDPQNVEALRMRSLVYDKMGNSAAAAMDTSNADTLQMQKMLDSNKQ